MRARVVSVFAAAAAALCASLAAAGCASVLGFEDFTPSGADASDVSDTGGGSDARHDGTVGLGSEGGPGSEAGSDGGADSADGTTTHDTGTDAPLVDGNGPDAHDGGNAPDADGGLVCDAGAKVCGATCVDPGTSESNCGVCGHSCLGGKCLGGVCQPVTLSGSGAPAYGITVDAKNVYFLGQPGLLACAKGGCGSSPSGPYAAPYSYSLGGHIEYDAVSALLYVTGASGNEYDAFTVLPDGGSVAKIAGSANPVCLTSTAEAYYWYVDGIVFTKAKTGGPFIQVMTNVTACSQLAIDDSAVYVADGTNLVACMKGAGTCATPQVLASAGQPQIVATEPDSNNVLFAFNTTIYRCPYNGCPDPTKPTVWANKQLDIAGITVDSTTVYWVDQSKGAILKCPLGASCPNPITMVSGITETPTSIAQDSEAVYWTLNSGNAGVQKVAK